MLEPKEKDPMLKKLPLITTMFLLPLTCLSSDSLKKSISPYFVFNSEIRFTAQIDYEKKNDISKTITFKVLSDTRDLPVDWNQVPRLKAEELLDKNIYKILGTPFTLSKNIIPKKSLDEKTSTLTVSSQYNFNLSRNSKKILLNILRKGESPVENIKAPYHDMEIYYPETKKIYENIKSKNNSRQLLVLRLGKGKKMSLLKMRRGTLKMIFSGMSQIEAFAIAISTL